MKHCLMALAAWMLILLPAHAATPARIISLAPNVTEVLYDLGLGDRIIAVSRYCNYPPEAGRKPKVGGMSDPSLEVIIALKPDRVVMTDDGNPREIEARLREMGIRTEVFRAKRIQDLPREIAALGAALGIRDRAAGKADAMEKALRRYGKKFALKKDQIPRKALFIIEPEPLVVAGPGTAIDDVIRLLGMQNAAAGMKSAYPSPSLEDIARQAPDIIFIGKGHREVPAQSQYLLKRLYFLEAVRKGRVYYLGDSLYRMGPRIIAGIAEMAGFVDK